MGEVTQIIGILMVVALISYYAYSYNYSKKLGLDEELEETWMGEKYAVGNDGDDFRWSDDCLGS